MHTSFISILALAGLAFGSQALGAAQIFNKEGDVQSFREGTTSAPVGNRMRIEAGRTVSTGPGGKVILRFDDGMQVALNENTTVKIVEYKFRDASLAAKEDLATLELSRGAVRVVTGLMVERSPKAFMLRGPQAELQVRDAADFSVALVNPMYLAVHQGIVVMSNQAGRLALAQGSTVQIANANAVPLTMQASAMPQVATQAFQNLQVAGLTTPGAAASGALPTTAAASGTGFGIGTPALFMGAAAAAAAGALNSGGDDEGGGSSTTHH